MQDDKFHRVDSKNKASLPELPVIEDKAQTEVLIGQGSSKNDDVKDLSEYE